MKAHCGVETAKCTRQSYTLLRFICLLKVSSFALFSSSILRYTLLRFICLLKGIFCCKNTWYIYELHITKIYLFIERRLYLYKFFETWSYTLLRFICLLKVSGVMYPFGLSQRYTLLRFICLLKVIVLFTVMSIFACYTLLRFICLLKGFLPCGSPSTWSYTLLRFICLLKDFCMHQSSTIFCPVTHY